MKITGLTSLFLLACVAAFCLPLGGESPGQRALSLAWQAGGQMKLQTGNYGCFTDLHYPQRDAADLLFISAPWISAKKPRRDASGNLLYWVNYPPTAATAEVVAYGQPGWDPSLVAVWDTLTSIGFDGDYDLYELLPAYNPYLAGNPDAADLYLQYSGQDIVLRSILGQPSPREFAFPDPLGTYCFTIPQPEPFATPGFETLSAYYYDFCPFGTVGDRDWGSSRSMNTHYPLGLAVHQASYAWSPLPLSSFVVTQYTVYNTSDADTLYDLALGNYVDADMGPAGTENIAGDDISGYVKGPGYEFGYSYDADGDAGLEPWYLGHKLLLPGGGGNRNCWYWHIGDGPDDFHPLDLYPDYGVRQTPNEKHWLLTGRNPNYTQFLPLRPLDPNVPEYEQPQPCDTRFLNALCGNIPTPADPNPAGRWHLAPGASLSWYSIHFAAPDLISLKQLSQFSENFIASSFDLGPYTSQPCLPWLRYSLGAAPGTLDLDWHSYSDPDHFLLLHRISGTADWNEIQLPGSARTYTLGGLQEDVGYDLQVLSVYDPGANQIVLPSEIVQASLNLSAADDPVLVPAPRLTASPNPFKNASSIAVGAFKSGDGSFRNAELAVYNVKGQKIRVLDCAYAIRNGQTVVWDGRDEKGVSCPKGIYLARLSLDGRPGGHCKLVKY